jgi:FixJ family two-component response regulator
VLDEAPGSGLLMAHLALSAYERGDAEETARWAQRARATDDADGIVHAAAAALLAPAHAFAGRAAGLVAEGRTNREIAARLYLSEKTIETVLSRVFRKLDVRSRVEVAARIAAADQD